MFETASAQSIGLFQSPSLTAVERLLSSLTGRISGLDRFFLNRQESFVERVFSRHFDAIGLPEWRQAPVARAVPAAAWQASSGWVSAPREQRPTGTIPTRSVAATPVAPPAQPVARVPAVAQRPAAVAPVGLPIVSPDAGPAAAGGRPLATAPVATRSADPTSLTPAAAPLRTTPPTSAAVPSLGTTSAPTEARTLAVPSQADVATSLPAQLEPTPALAAGSASPASAAVAELGPGVGAVAASAQSAIALPTVGAISQADVRRAADTSSQPQPTPPVDERVRDLLPRTAVASPMAPVVPASAAPRAKSFQHLSWADTQLSRSPWWRAATLPSLGISAAATSAPTAMPVLQTPELAPPARSHTEVAVPARPNLSPAPTVRAAAKPSVAGPLPTLAAAPSIAGAAVRAVSATSDDPTVSATPQLSRDVSQAAIGQTVEAAPARLATAVAGASHPTSAIEQATAADLPSVAASNVAPRVDAVAPAVRADVTAGGTPAIVASALPAGRRENFSAPLARSAAPTVPASQLLRVDPGLVPQVATRELAQVLAGRDADVRTPSPISWAQPGGLWSQPAWSPSGILARMADGPLNTQLAAWHAAPGVASTVRRYAAQAGTVAAASSPVPVLPRPWVAPEMAPTVASARRTEPAPATDRVLPMVMPARPTAQIPPVGSAMAAPAAAGFSAAPSEPVPQRSVLAPSVQPWRQAGGVAALAELFAAGVGLGSGMAASSAQVEGGAPRPSLVADWLQPLILSPAATAVGLADRHAPPLAPTGIPSVVAPTAFGTESRGRAAAVASPQAPSLSALPFVPAAGANERLIPRRVPTLTATGVASSQTVSPTASTPAPQSLSAAGAASLRRVDLAAPSTAASDFVPSLSSAASLFPALPVGGLGLLAQRFAGNQSQRAISGGLPFVAEAATWAAAPGLPATLQRDLRQAVSPTAAAPRSPNAAAGLPYLSLLPRVASEAGPRTTAAATPGVPSQPTAAARPNIVSQASKPEAVSGSGSVSAAAGFAAPWFAPGGGGTLAELFATGIATTSGAAAWLTQLHAQAPQGVVPSWVGQWLASPPSAAAATLSSSATDRSAVPSLPYLRAASERAPLATSGATPARGETTATGSSASPRAARQVLPRLGLASVRAEQFAAQQGLVAAPSGPGQWAPVSGGLVWLPTPAAATTQGAATSAVAQQRGPSAAAGGLGLRSELFVRREQARVLQPGERMVSTLGLSATSAEPAKATEAPGSTSSRWAQAGQLMYLPASSSAPSAAATGAAQAGSQGVHVSPLTLARPWSVLPAELRRLGLSSLAGHQAPTLPSLTQPSAASSVRPLLPRVADVPAVAPRAASRMPVLAADSLRSDPEVRLVRNQPVPTVVASQRPYELAARFASPMLTAFPPAERGAPIAAKPEAARPQMLWPQTATVSRERIERVLAMLPAGLPSSGPLAALADLTKSVGPNTGTGMPLWQRLPASLPTGLPAVTAPAGQDSERHTDADDSEHARASHGPDLTLLQGDRPSRPRRSSEPAQRPAAAKPANTPPPVEVFKAALAASGASREHVEASAKLMQVIQGQASGQGARGDDRLSLEDLTLVAISMGQGRMAAANPGGGVGIPSIEAAIGLPAAMHPTVAQDDREARRKIDQMAKDVFRKVKELKTNQGVRDGFDM